MAAGKPAGPKKPASPKKQGIGMNSPKLIAGAAVAVVVALFVAYSHGPTSFTVPARAEPTATPGRVAKAAEPLAKPAPPKQQPNAVEGSAIELQASLIAKQSVNQAAKATQECTNSAADGCESWAEHGECERNPAFMHANCARSCRLCDPVVGTDPPVWLLPEVAGVDWAALAASDAAAAPPADEEIAMHCPVGSLLSPRLIPGLHIICRLPSAPAHASGTAALGSARLAVWRDADRSKNAGKPSHVFALPATFGKSESLAELIGAVGARLRFEWRGAQWQTPAFFTPDGIRLTSTAAVGSRLAAGPICLYEGGQFIWPPGEVGSSREVALPDGHLATIRTLSLQPIVLSIENFLRPEEAGHIIELAKPHLAKSGVALKDHDIGKEAKEFRTSSQYFLPTSGDASLEEIDARVQALMRVPITHAEYIQVLRYNLLEHYSAHHDFFDPKEYASNAHMRAETKMGAKNRLATVFFYLSDVEEGGATNFPRAGGAPPPRDFFDCSKGLSVYPQLGKVIVFYSMHPSSELDKMSLHGGCDVVNGTKYSANFWLWNEPYHFNSNHRQRAFETYKKEMHQ